jgi:hypothetical protein
LHQPNPLRPYPKSNLLNIYTNTQILSISTRTKITNSQILDLTAEDAQYIYCANGPAAVLFSVLFGLTFLVHLAQAFLFRKRFCWVIVVGSGWQCIGLIMRTYSTIDQTKTSTAAAGQLLVLLTPLWVNAFVYMIFGRMVYYYVPDQRVAGIKAQSLAKVFIWLDIL